MSSPRARRSDRPARGVSPRVWAVVLVVVGVLGAGGVAVGLFAGRPDAAVVASPSADLPSTPASTPATSTVVEPATVEVPDVTGMRREDAVVVLSAAGLTIQSSSSSDTPSGLTIESQDPAAGTLVDAGTVVLVGLSRPKAAVESSDKAAETPKRRFTVCIDPGHQSRGDSAQEPVGPGASETKARVTGGATGVKTGVPEYELVLQISMNLKERLEAQGVRVVMTRTTNDVRLGNSERAQKANRADADLFVRIHCDGSTDSSLAGVSTLYPGSNKWTSGFAAESKRAAKRVQHAVVVSTSAVDRGVKARTDLSGFNWSKVPCVLVECGFLSNPVEDRLLASPHYQDKLAEGLADGITQHLEDER